MSAQFVALALSYSIGNGKLTLKGAKRRPWLELRRSETERTYLDHQVRALRKRHDGPLDVIWDRLPGHGFYDIERVRIQGEGLWRVYELLYPRDVFTLTDAVTDLLGIEHLAAMWIDRGRVRGRAGSIRWPSGRHDEIAVLWRFCSRLGHPPRDGRLSFDREATKELVAALRPHIHVSMRRTISLRKPVYEAPKLKVLDGAFG